MKKLLGRFKKFSPAISGIFLLALIAPGVTFATSLVGSESLQGMAEVAAVVINIFTFLTLLLLNFGGELLGTDLITGPEAMAAIHPMWVWVRNLVNVVFVGVIVFLAFSNLFASFKGEGGNWTIKDKLPKIILSLVAINFSLLGFRLIIDGINVGTVAILGIADTKLEGTDSNTLNSIVKQRAWISVDNEEKKEILEKTVKEQNFFKPEDIIDLGIGKDCTNVRAELKSAGNEKIQSDSDPAQIVVKDSNTEKMYVCASALEQINDTFCAGWQSSAESESDFDSWAEDHDCLFKLNQEHFAGGDSTSSSVLTPHSKPGRNLFMAFGTVFMHLERLPQLGARLGSLSSVLDNTLFSGIMAIAYLTALVAIFVALIARVVVLWLGLVFSPVLVAASIMGFGESGGDLGKKLITHIIMPLKIAAAFAVSFVMLSAMVTFSAKEASINGQAFQFGPALSQMGQGEYAILWQIATIVIFWMAAFWAIEGNLASTVTNYIKTGIETLGTTAAKAATIYRPIFAVGTGKEKVSLGALAQMPSAIKYNQESAQRTQADTLKIALGMGTEADQKTTNLINDIQSRNLTASEVFKKMSAAGAASAGNARVYNGLVNHDNPEVQKMMEGISESQWTGHTEEAMKQIANKSTQSRFLEDYKDKPFKDHDGGSSSTDKTATDGKTSTNPTKVGNDEVAEQNAFAKNVVINASGGVVVGGTTVENWGEFIENAQGKTIQPQELLKASQKFSEPPKNATEWETKVTHLQNGKITIPSGEILDMNTQGTAVENKYFHVVTVGGTSKVIDIKVAESQGENLEKLTELNNAMKTIDGDIDPVQQKKILEAVGLKKGKIIWDAKNKEFKKP